MKRSSEERREMSVKNVGRGKSSEARAMKQKIETEGMKEVS